MSEMTFAFPTARLRVFEASVTPWLNGGLHTVYLAFLSSQGAPQTVAQAVVSDWRGTTGPVLCAVYCELVEVSSMFRGSGYGEELFRGIEKHLQTELAATAVTADGRKLLGKLGRNADALAPHLEEIQQLVDGLAAVPGQQQWVADVTALNGNARDLQRPIQERMQAIRDMKRIMAEQLVRTAQARPGSS